MAVVREMNLFAKVSHVYRHSALVHRAPQHGGILGGKEAVVIVTDIYIFGTCTWTQDLIGCTEGGHAQSASSVSAAGSHLCFKLFSFHGWRHWGDKGVDNREAVGRDAAWALQSRQTPAWLHLAGRRVPKWRQTALAKIQPWVSKQTQRRSRSLTVQLSGWAFSLDRFGGLERELRLSEAVVCLLQIGFRRRGFCIVPGAVLGRDEPGCNTHTLCHF